MGATKGSRQVRIAMRESATATQNEAFERRSSTESALLAARGTSTWTDALALQRCTLVEELHAARERLSLIDRMLTPGEIPMTIQLNRTAVPAMTVVALRGTVPSYSDEGRLWERLMPALQQQGIRPVGPCGVIEHDDEYREADVDLRYGLASLYTQLDKLPAETRDAIRADIDALAERRPALAMVDSDKGITNLHVPSDVIIDASMPVVIRDSGQMWNAEGGQQ